MLFVVLSVQEVAESNSRTEAEFAKNNVILLGPNALSKIYSPTLKSRIPKLTKNTAPEN